MIFVPLLIAVLLAAYGLAVGIMTWLFGSGDPWEE
jgi:hypothetical protein